jgi:hypothetical protein
METSQDMVNKVLGCLLSVSSVLSTSAAPGRRVIHKIKKPTTGIEPVNLILTKDVLYLLSYMGMVKAGNETRTHNSHLGRVELYQLSYTRDLISD